MSASWARCVGGALAVASQGAKGPDAHLPLQARWRMLSERHHSPPPVESAAFWTCAELGRE
eukprot:9118583-Pyramimonas_sp.AAC.1